MIKNITNISPHIRQLFSCVLLSTPIHKDDLEMLWKIYKYIKIKLMKKVIKCPSKLKKCLKLEKEFLELYEKAKEKELKKDPKNTTERPFYFIAISDKRYRKIFDRLRQKRNRVCSTIRTVEI